MKKKDYTCDKTYYYISKYADIVITKDINSPSI